MAKPVSVLVLDDDRNFLSSIERLFKAEPYAVFTTLHPFEALGVLAREPIKVVICDQRMPVVSGNNFLKEVKDNFPDMVRILFTGHADMRAAEEAVNKGQVFAFLFKPCEPDLIVATIRRAIEAYESAAVERRLVKSFKEEKPALLLALAEAKADLDKLSSGTSGALSAEQQGLISRVSERVVQVTRSFDNLHG